MRFDHPLIVSLAKKYGKDPAHIFLRYSLQKVWLLLTCLLAHHFTDMLRAQGFVPLVKSADRTRILSNADVFDFELDPTEMTELDRLDECTHPSSVVITSCPFIVNVTDKRLGDRLGSN